MDRRSEMEAPRSMLSLWGGPLAPWDMLMRVLGRPGRSGRYSGGARVISSCGSSAMVEAATVTIIAHHLHHRVLTKHEIVDRAAAASQSHDGAMVRGLRTENPRQARSTECTGRQHLESCWVPPVNRSRGSGFSSIVERAGAEAKVGSRLIRTWSGRLRVRAGQMRHGTVPCTLTSVAAISSTPCAELSFRQHSSKICGDVRSQADVRPGDLLREYQIAHTSVKITDP